jgi:hypothetical protein
MGRDLRQFIARSGVSFESAELADWMSFLFADRKEDVLSMVAEVEAQEVSARAQSVLAKAESSGLGQAATKLARVGSDAQAEAPSKERDTVAPPRSSGKRALRLEGQQADDEPVSLPTRSRAWVWALVALVLLGGSAFAAYQVLGVELGLRPAAPRATTALEGQTTVVAAPEPTTPEPTTTPEPAPLAGAPAVAAPAAGAPPAQGGSAAPPVAPASPPHVAASAREAPAPVPPVAVAEASPERAPTTTLDTSQGEVLVQADGGWAEVYLGDRLLGRTPLRTNLPVGRQALRLLPYGREPAQNVTVPVEWGAINRVTIRLGPSTPLPDPDQDDEPSHTPIVTDSPYGE